MRSGSKLRKSCEQLVALQVGVQAVFHQLERLARKLQRQEQTPLDSPVLTPHKREPIEWEWFLNQIAGGAEQK